MSKPKAIQLYLDSRKMLKRLSKEQRGEWIDAVLAYADGDDVDVDSLSQGVAVAFEVTTNQIDRDFEKYSSKCEKNRKAGQKSAEARSERQQALTNVNECKQVLISFNEINQEEKEEEKENNNKEKNIKEKYGVLANVLLTKEEHSKLKEQFSDYQDRIDRLSEYIASTGKRYKSHYATILSWARKDKPDGKPPGKNKNRGSMYSAEGASFDLEKYERSDLFDG